MKNKILIIGSGAREHALGWKLKQSPKVGKIYFAPGTAGTEQIGENTGIAALDFEKLTAFAIKNKIDFTVAAPDDILAAGIVDAFQKKGLKIFGPTKKAAQIEWSKVFSKQLMKEEKIPTARYETFTDFAKAKKYISKQNFPIVIKADGLALGKGVIIAQSQEEAKKTLEDILVKKIFGKSGSEVVIEEFMQGPEVSIHAFSDGKNVALFPTSRDHKPIFEGNKGPNTGGMGTIAPLPDITTEQLEEIKTKIVIPAIRGMKKRGAPFVGCLYPGLMMTADGPKVVEFNSRFGDPEMESYMRLLETDIFEILNACVEKTLDKQKIKWSKKFACCIALASATYPEGSHKGDVIHGLNKIKNKDVVVFHFATKKENGNIVTNGGRVLGVTATGQTLDSALDKAYNVIGENGIHFDGMQYRKDIGRVKPNVIAIRQLAEKHSLLKIRAVIFDMDGLMLDSEPIQSQAFAAVVREYGKTPKMHASGIIQTPGFREKENWEEIMQRHNFKEDIQTLSEKRRKKYGNLLRKHAKMQPGLKQLLILLKRKQIKTAIASSSSIEHIQIALDVLDIGKYFDATVSGKSVPRGKPFPDTFLEAAKQLGMASKQCLVLEDAENGVVAGHAAGMKVIAVPNIYTKAHDFSKADAVVNSLEDIDLNVIERNTSAKGRSASGGKQSQTRIEIFSKIPDTRAEVKKKKLLHINSKIKNVSLADIYTIDKNFAEADLQKISSALSNPVTQEANLSSNRHSGKRSASRISYRSNESDSGQARMTNNNFSWAIEIGFLPGVTDNIANTAKETAEDLLKTKFVDQENIYTSQILFLDGKLTKKDVQEIAESLYNPLIQRAHIKSFEEFAKDGGMDTIVPKVKLDKEPEVSEVNLNVSDEELAKIGKAGVPNGDGTHRGPLALDLTFMKTIQKYFKKLKRNPTDIELESIAQTWSEHCKHTIFADPIDEIKDGLFRTYIKRATDEIRKKQNTRDFCVSVFTDNSGGIALDENWMVTHKVETHNSPSALDPFGGSITGIVGVNRDAIGFGLGAKPVANFYGFCFADPRLDIPLYKGKDKTQKMLSSRRIMDGVIDGVNAGGNQSGIPTPQGFVYFDERYRGKPMVFVGTVGLIPRKINGKLSHVKKANPGDLIVMLGGRVGKDGIHGATFSSEAMDSGSPATAVQIGDPITQKKLSDAIVKEARDLLLYTSLTDNGAGGLSCSVAEMGKESGGAVVDLEKVPLKYPGLNPWETWISESQERMTLSVPKKNWEKFSDLMKRRGVEATVIGKFTDSGKCIVNYNQKTIMDIDMDFLHDGLPTREMKTKKPSPVIPSPSTSLRVNKIEGSYDKTLLQMLSRLNVTSYEFISQQYDYIVQGNAVLGPLQGRGRVNADTSVIRPVLNTNKGVITSQGLYPSYSELDPYRMSAASIDTAIRNAVAAGANPDYLSLLDNFCWCSSNDPERLYQLKLAAKACYDYAIAYGTPFVSGKDSMFNDFKGFDQDGNPIKISIPPTLLITSFGVVDDITKVVSLDAKHPGDLVYILGKTFDEMGGSEYAALQNHLQGGRMDSWQVDVPKVDAEKNSQLYHALYQAIQSNLVASSISIGHGGLGVALAKKAIGGMIGVTIDLNKLPGDTSRDDFALYSESQGRILVTINKENQTAFEKIIAGNSFAKIGKVNKTPRLVIKGLKEKEIINMQLNKAVKSYRETFKDY